MANKPEISVYVYNGTTSIVPYIGDACEIVIPVYNGISNVFTYMGATCEVGVFTYNGQSNVFVYDSELCIICLKWSDHLKWGTTHRTWGCTT